MQKVEPTFIYASHIVVSTHSSHASSKKRREAEVKLSGERPRQGGECPRKECQSSALLLHADTF